LKTIKTIEITVSPQGITKVQTKGFNGSSCNEASKFLEEALGKRLVEQRTAEFYQPQAAEQLQQQGH
jgi:hypothetical protein